MLFRKHVEATTDLRWEEQSLLAMVTAIPIASFRRALKETFADLVSVEIAVATWHILFGLVAFLIGKVTGLSSDIAFLVMIALVSNLISFLFISLFSIAVATQTFKRGLDPDNFVIPLVASVSDVSATLALMATLTILGV